MSVTSPCDIFAGAASLPIGAHREDIQPVGLDADNAAGGALVLKLPPKWTTPLPAAADPLVQLNPQGSAVTHGCRKLHRCHPAVHHRLARRLKPRLRELHRSARGFDGLPAGMQVIGRCYADADVLDNGNTVGPSSVHGG